MKNSKSASDIDGLRYMNMSQLATVTRLDRRTVKDKLVDLKPYKIEKTAHYYDSHRALSILLGLGDPNKNNQELQELEVRIERAKAEKLETELAKTRGQLVPVEDVCKVVEKEYTYVRSSLVAIPSKRAKELAMETDPAIIQQILDQEIHETLEHLQADKNFSTEGTEELAPVEE